MSAASTRTKVGELEAALEGAGGDPHVEEIAVLVAILRLAADHHQHVLAGGDVDVAGREAGDGERDPVAVVAQFLDVVGRVIVGLLGAGAFEEIEQPVEADGGAAIGREIEASHDLCPPMSNMTMRGGGKEARAPRGFRPDTCQQVVRRRRFRRGFSGFKGPIPPPACWGRGPRVAETSSGRELFCQILLDRRGQLGEREGLAKHRHLAAERAFELLALGIAGDEDDRQAGCLSRAARATSAPFIPGIA
jgi:hypothetical protein